MLDKTEQSVRAPNPNEKPESCYCSALPNGSGPYYARMQFLSHRGSYGGIRQELAAGVSGHSSSLAAPWRWSL
jgi:hypothetical protein